MKVLTKWIILISLLLAAFMSYQYGFSQGAAAFVILGVMLELTFWFGVFGKKKKHKKHWSIQY